LLFFVDKITDEIDVLGKAKKYKASSLKAISEKKGQNPKSNLLIVITGGTKKEGNNELRVINKELADNHAR
jgi:hypothetical protein